MCSKLNSVFNLDIKLQLRVALRSLHIKQEYVKAFGISPLQCGIFLLYSFVGDRWGMQYA